MMRHPEKVVSAFPHFTLCSRLAAAAWVFLTGWSAALAEDLPKIEFEQVLHDFKTVSGTDTLTGVFKFRNTGKADLMMPQPTTSCGCTLARMDKFIYHPGEEGSVGFEWKLTGTRGAMTKTVTLQSNDPHNPKLILTIKADYTPLYELEPISLMVNPLVGQPAAGSPVKIFRTDSKPLQIRRLETSQPWITARMAGEAEILVEVRGLAPPRRYNESVFIYAGDNDKTPVTTLPVFGGITGEIVTSPQSLFWSITDAGLLPDRPEAIITRRFRVRSVSGKDFQISKLASSLKGMSLELNELGPEGYEVTARLDEVPRLGHEGFLTFDTTEPSMPQMTIPITVAVITKRRDPPADNEPEVPAGTASSAAPAASSSSGTAAPAIGSGTSVTGGSSK